MEDRPINSNGLLPFEEKYRATQSKICNFFLVLNAFLLIPGVVAGLVRVGDIGWQPDLLPQYILVSIALLLAFFRKKLSYIVRATSITATLFMISATGMWASGFVSEGATLMLLVPVLVAVFFNTRLAVYSVVLISAALALIGTNIVLTGRVPPFDLEAYVTSPMIWAFTVAIRAIIALALVLTVGAVTKFLLKSLAKAESGAEALQKSEERFALAMRGANDGLWDFDLISSKIYCSPRWYTMLGYDPEEFSVDAEVLGQLINSADRERVNGLVADCIAGSRDGFRTEFKMLHADGSLRDIVSRAFIVREEGVAVRMVGTHVDVTARKTLEAQVRHAQKMEAVGQLTGGLAHDFNNLLAVIMGNVELLDQEINEKGVLAEKDELVGAILEAVDRGAGLTQHLLAFSRQQPLNARPIDAEALIDKMKSMLDRTLGETIKIETHVAPGVWNAFADHGQLENALLNLALNGRDAMPKGGKLIFSANNTHIDQPDHTQLPGIEPGDYLVLSVADTGVGMSSEVRSKAFEPFYTTKEVGQGSGLGLSMVYGFARQSGGSVSIYSEGGHGTTVRVYLPRSQSELPEVVEVEKLKAPKGEGETVLVLEDDVPVLKLVVTMLDGLGYHVLQAETAAEANALIADGVSVDLILSDVILPGGTSGPVFMEEMHVARPSVKMLFMSGYSMEAAKGNGLLDGEVDLLTKPFSRDELANALHKALTS